MIAVTLEMPEVAARKPAVFLLGDCFRPGPGHVVRMIRLNRFMCRLTPSRRVEYC